MYLGVARVIVPHPGDLTAGDNDTVILTLLVKLIVGGFT